MSKRKISRCFQRETDKIIDEAEEKIENEFHEEESDARLPNLKPGNFQTKWLNEFLKCFTLPWAAERQFIE